MNRNHSLDFARAFMLLLGIPFHVTEVYGVNQNWFFNSGQGSDVAAIIGSIIHSFRMPAFFALAGFFAAMMLARYGSITWLKSRLKRVAIPLVASVVLLGFFEALICHYQVYSDLGEAANVAIDGFPKGWLIHRWFLIVLLVYIFASVILYPIFDKIALIIPTVHSSERVVLSSLTILVSLWCYFAFEVSLAFEGKFYFGYVKNSLIYAPFFALGYLAFKSNAIFKIIFTIEKSKYFIAVISLVLFITCEYYISKFQDESASQFFQSIYFLAFSLAGIFVSSLIFGLSSKFIGKSTNIVNYFVSGSMVMYLFHLIFVLFFSHLFLYIQLPAILEVILISVLTLMSVIIVFETIRRVSIVSILFNGAPIRI